MIKKLLVLLFLLLTSHLLNSQESRKMISGSVVSDSLSVENVHVINLTSKYATITNAFGEFKIPVKENDTLYFSSILFEKKEVVIRKLYFKTLRLTIPLKASANLLDEVTVKSHNLTGNLSTDISSYVDSVYESTAEALDFSGIDFSVPVINELDEIDRAKPPNAGKLTNPNISVGGDILGFMLRPLIKEVSKIGRRKRIEKRKQAKRAYQADKVPDKLRDDFGEDFFVQILKIETYLIDSFIEHCMNKGLVNLYFDNKKIELIDLLLKESTVFLSAETN